MNWELGVFISAFWSSIYDRNPWILFMKYLACLFEGNDFHFYMRELSKITIDRSQ